MTVAPSALEKERIKPDDLRPTSSEEDALDAAIMYHDFGQQLRGIRTQQRLNQHDDDEPIMTGANPTPRNPGGYLENRKRGDLDGTDFGCAEGVRLVSYARQKELLADMLSSIEEENADNWRTVEEQLKEVQRKAHARRLQMLAKPPEAERQ